LGHLTACYSVLFGPEPGLLVSLSSGVKLWSVRGDLAWQPPYLAAEDVCESPVRCGRLARDSHLLTGHENGKIMKWKLNIEPGRPATIQAIRTYFHTEIQAPIVGLSIVTAEVQRTQRNIVLSVADDCVLMDTQDNLHRICSLQKSSIRVLQELSGARCTKQACRSTISPDGSTVVSGSESGEFFVWHVVKEKPLLLKNGPKLRIGAGIPDVVWSPTHHLIACAGYGAPGTIGNPLLVYIYDRKQHGAPKPLVFSADDHEVRAPMASGLQDWKSQWLENTGGGKVIGAADKRALKEAAFAEASRAAQLENALRVPQSTPALLNQSANR
jgi:WD40 repeat protein